MFIDLLMPVFQLVEGTFVGNVVHKQCGDSALIVSLCDGPEALLAGGVPNLYLDNLVLDEHAL